jgi:hypothetical protein
MAYALGARIFQPFLPTYAATLLTAAERSWAWLQANPNLVRYSTAGFNGAIADSNSNWDKGRRLAYDFSFAKTHPSNYSVLTLVLLTFSCAAELFATTGNTAYRTYFDAHYLDADAGENDSNFNPLVANSVDTAVAHTLLYSLVAYCRTPGASTAPCNTARAAWRNGLGWIRDGVQLSDPYRSGFYDGQYGWGSNQQKGLSAITFMLGIMIDAPTDAATRTLWRQAALEYMQYLHGVNPLSWVYFTNSQEAGASNPVTRAYNAWWGTEFFSGMDQGPAPPGVLTGGPNVYYDGTQTWITQEPQYVRVMLFWGACCLLSLMLTTILILQDEGL